MINKLEHTKKEYKEISEKLEKNEVISDQREYQRLARKQKELSKIIDLGQRLEKVEKDLKEAKNLAQSLDLEEKKLGEEEMASLKNQKEGLEQKLQLALLPKDENDSKNVIMEIRAGAGGDEASLFVASLFKMYSHYAEKMNWKIEILSSNKTGLGGFKEIIFSVKNSEVYKYLKYESGVHRVQRVPETESSGRIHTSTVTVAVLPEAEEVDIEVKPEDLRVDVFRSSGPGGQSVNTTDSAVRITHVPTGIVVSCQDEKSQLKNKAKALSILRSRLLFFEEEKRNKEIGKNRKAQIGTGERSEKIRTYNFPQDRITEHRIGLSLHHIENIFSGDLDKIINPLLKEDQKRKLNELS